MSDSLRDFMTRLEAWSPSDRDVPLLEGAVDPHRSDDAYLYFGVRPCRGSWLRIPGDTVAGVRILGEVECGAVVFPRVEVELVPDAPATPLVLDAVRAATVGGGVGGAPGAAPLGGDDGEGASHDVRLELEPRGKLYRIRLQVEGHDVKAMEWDSERGVHVATLPGLVAEDALDVKVQAWGNEGAGLVLSVEVDGRALKPPMEATVTDRPGEARRSYRL